MEKRPLGSSELKVAPWALGGNVFGWTIDQATSFQVLDAFLENGFQLIDTANMYSTWAPGNQGGESETIIGNWFQQSGKRDQVVLATKVGMPMGDGTQGLKKDYILKSAEASLSRLKTDVIDLYQSHQDDPETPIEETLEAYQQLIRQGKVRAIGLSNFRPDRLRTVLEIGQRENLPLAVSLQPEYNLYDRQDYETQLEPICQEFGLAVIPYYSLASGFLTGKYRSAEDAQKSARGQGVVQKYLNDRGKKILAALDQISQHHHTDPVDVALAWLIRRPSITAPIASATSVTQVQQLARAANLSLGDDEVEQLNQASAY